MKQKRLGAAIRKFTAAIMDRPDRDTVAIATGTLIQTLAGAAHDQSTQVFAALLDRIDAQDARLRDIEMNLMVMRADMKRVRTDYAEPRATPVNPPIQTGTARG